MAYMFVTVGVGRSRQKQRKKDASVSLGPSEGVVICYKHDASLKMFHIIVSQIPK